MLRADSDTRVVADSWREQVYIIIFEHDTPLGKAFDVSLLVAILLSILNVMLDSVSSIQAEYGGTLLSVEWVLTVVFTIEYVLRIVSARRPWRYVFSFLGLIDLLSIIPTFLSLLIPGSQALLTIRALRLLRVFRVLKLADYLREATSLGLALEASKRKIVVFLVTVLTLAVIMGSLMYVIEGAENGFTSIPRGVYWAIVTMTTVGYGDIAPHTVLGQMVATMVMILGYGIIAVPTGIVSAELVSARTAKSFACPSCNHPSHLQDAHYCAQCGHPLDSSQQEDAL